MATDDLKVFVEDRIRSFDPSVDLNDGSPAQDQIVDPIVRRFSPDPFEMDLNTYLTTLLEQTYPDTNFREGSGLRDLLVKPATLLLDPIHREVQLIKQAQSLAAPELLSSDEADSLVANVFISRQLGDLSSGVIRLYFNAPVAVNISVGNVCFTSDGLRFLPTSLQSISAESMVFNQSGSLYYFDINVTAERPGDSYNIIKNKIVGITHLNAAVRVTNLDRFSGGLPEESTLDMVSRAENSITERSLVVPRGVSARLFAQFTALAQLQVIGHSDPEMQRDVITGGDLGPILLSGQDGFTEDDGDGDAYSNTLRCRFSNFVSLLPIGLVKDHFITATEINSGIDGEIISSINIFRSVSAVFEPSDIGSLLRTFNSVFDNNGFFEIIGYTSPNEVTLNKFVGTVEYGLTWILTRKQQDLEIKEIINATTMKVGGRLHVDKPIVSFAIRKKVITISDIPGGIVFSADRGSIEIKSDEIHIGGCSDFYVKGSSLEKESLVLGAVSDEEPVIRSLTGSTLLANTAFFRDTAADFILLGVKVGMSLVIENGPDAGTRTVLRVGVSPLGLPDITYLQVSPAISATAVALRYKIVDILDINLRVPKNIRGQGFDGETVAGNSIFTTTDAVDFITLGVLIGDVLNIKSGFDKRSFSVIAIGGTGNRDLTLSGSPTSTAVNLEWEVYLSQSGLSFPLIRLTSLSILDSSSQPTGDTIPFADPVDIRSEAFANVGHGTKLSTIEAVTGIVGTLAMNTVVYPLATTTIGIKINNGAIQNVFLTGSMNKEEVVSRINVVVPNIADIITVSGEPRVAIRSLDRWLQIVPSAQNTNIGLNLAGEDNRQIRSADIAAWNSLIFDLKRRTDVVYITTGDNVGLLYPVEVQADRIYVVGFDEEDGSVRFLQPNTNVSLTIGSRSIGNARIYFLDPTSFQVRGDYRPALKSTATKVQNFAVFSAAELALPSGSIPVDEEPLTYFTADINGHKIRFIPDPELNYSLLPDPDSDVPNNLKTTAALSRIESSSTVAGNLGKNSRAASIDFLSREVHVGDLIDLTFQPIQGTGDLNSFPGLVGLTLIMSVDGAPAKTLTFTSDVTTTAKLTEAINDFWGVTVAFIETYGPTKNLRLEADYPILIRKNGTANTLLGFSTGTDRNNKAVADINGYYKITQVSSPTSSPTATTRLDVYPVPAVSGESQHFMVLRPGMQRLHSTAMSKQIETGLYYMDVELVSEGPGDVWNIPDNTELIAVGYQSDGYRLVVLDSNLSYSTEEDVKIQITRRILAVGQSDRPDQATAISQQNLQVDYERSSLAASIQSFASSDLERVLTASILVRHLHPTFVNFDMNYKGGSGADIVRGDVDDFLATLGPDDRVESSDIQTVAIRRGASFVVNPLEVVAVVHDSLRKISVDRSANFVSKGRLSAWFPGVINVTRET